jgi:hypothetical protein
MRLHPSVQEVHGTAHQRQAASRSVLALSGIFTVEIQSAQEASGESSQHDIAPQAKSLQSRKCCWREEVMKVVLGRPTSDENSNSVNTSVMIGLYVILAMNMLLMNAEQPRNDCSFF